MVTRVGRGTDEYLSWWRSCRLFATLMIFVTNNRQSSYPKVVIKWRVQYVVCTLFSWICLKLRTVVIIKAHNKVTRSVPKSAIFTGFLKKINLKTGRSNTWEMGENSRRCFFDRIHRDFHVGIAKKNLIECDWILLPTFHYCKHSKTKPIERGNR